MTHPFTPDDLYLHRKISDLHVRSDGSAAVCSVRTVDREADQHRSHLWLFPLDGRAPPRQLTFHAGKDTSPRWSPGGERIALLSDRGGSPQVHVIDLEGGEARPCGSLPGAASAVRWCPDGRGLLATACVPVDPELRGRRGPPPPASGGKRPEIAWRLPYKSDGIGYLLQREVHLFRLDAGTGEHRQLTDGPFDVFGFESSPDGRHVAFTRTREGRQAHRTDLWVCAADGGGARQLTRDFATVLQPAWSPDGRRIAFAAARGDGDAQNNLWLLDFPMGELRQLGDDDLEVADPQSLQWTHDGRLLFTRALRGCHQACSIAADGSDLRTLVGGERQFGAFGMGGGRLAFSVLHPGLASELYACDLRGEGERRIGELNPWWKERMPMQVERRSFTVPDGTGGEEQVDGWLIRARDSVGPHPLLNDVHGGPASYALLDFDTNVFWQVLCSHGWAVLALNAVGSASYGRDFCSRLAGRWGELDLPQHLAAVRRLQEEGVCNAQVAIAGKSYGGFLSAWAVGHTQLFRSAVVMAPVGNIETHYGTSDGGYYADPRYVDSAPDFDRERARQLSPLQHIEKSRTPVLFLQGKDDERCPKCQSEEMFVSLVRAGDTPTELILYPGEGHHFLDEGTPSFRRDAATRIIEWVRRWCERADGAGETSPVWRAHSEKAGA